MMSTRTINTSKAAPMSDNPFTHLDDSGDARMVNVGAKSVTQRQATASVVCHMLASTAQAIRQDQIAKGNVLQVARLAAIGAAKRTDELIPLCHGLPLDGVDVSFSWASEIQLRIEVSVAATAKTGVEMEAMVAASIAALTVYDMCKAVDRSMVIADLQLERKSGGSRGEFIRNTES
ncbi:MAG: cyclic pyranopterin monophosphate synthase MoaC [Pirellulales bacterium]